MSRIQVSLFLAAIGLLMSSPVSASELQNIMVGLSADAMDGSSPPSDSSDPVEGMFSAGPPGALLVDRSHFQNFDIHTFTESLEVQGWIVDELTQGPVSYQLLQAYNVFIVPTYTGSSGIEPFTELEIEAVSHFLSGGAGLWLFHDYNLAPTGVNSLASTFGVEFQESLVQDPVDNASDPSWPYIRTFLEHPITEGIATIRLMAGCCMTVTDPSDAAASAGADASGSSCSSPPDVMATYSLVGRVAFFCDMTPLHAQYFPQRLTSQEIRLIENTISWLRTPGIVESERRSFGQLKARF